jgi:hypothetical protein
MLMPLSIYTKLCGLEGGLTRLLTTVQAQVLADIISSEDVMTHSTDKTPLLGLRC